MKHLLTIFLITVAFFPIKAQSSLPSKASYTEGDEISVYFSGLPGNAQDWVTISQANLPDNQYGEYFYLKGKKQGVLNFTNALPPGDYEVRTYFNWPDGGYKVMYRAAFKVMAKQEVAQTEEVSYYGLCNRGGNESSLKVSISNTSDWTVRFRLIDHGRAASEWTTISAKKSGSNSYSTNIATVDGVEIQWLDLAKWKNFNNMASIHKYGSEWHFDVTGAVFPPKPIKLN